MPDPSPPYEKPASPRDSDSDDDENGWEDMENDDIPQLFVSLFDDEVFEDVSAMFQRCKAKYGFDVWQIQQQYELDFIGLVKLVNYVRRSVSQGQNPPDISPSLFDDDSYLLPFLEGDAVLYNLEDVLSQARSPAKSRVEELEEQVAALQARYDSYRDDVSKYLTDKLDLMDSQIESQSIRKDENPDLDTDYFHSYSFNAIHETMLKDQVRTDAYRDFIYDNKHLFRDKIVLDVGCGTGVLSMFCARAGARQVIAVDNSDIIYTAQEIVISNGLDAQIRCIKGKIEEVELPVQSVDIIVSEWMGYALLYESMLDSVIHARDKYLKPDGLMVPSHATLRVGLVADSDVRETFVDFWHNVYGFDMSVMAKRTQQECIIGTAQTEELSGMPATFRVFNLHKVSVDDLQFTETFKVTSDKASEKLDGFIIWFDIIFNPISEPASDCLDFESARKLGRVAFTTGPHGIATHWQQAICLAELSSQRLNGEVVEGKVRFAKNAKDSRALDIEIQWQIAGSQPKFQTWHIQ